MLSITKINSAANQNKRGNPGGYLHYLGGPSTSTKQRGDFDDYARGDGKQAGPPPTWACSGSTLLGLSGIAESEQVERLAKGFHPVTGAALVKGAGEKHVMGLDMTFSAPKDVSAVFAGGDVATRDAVANAVMDAAKTAFAHVEKECVTRHGKAGAIKRFAQAAIAACYPHFASRAGEAQLHVHGFLFNLGKRKGKEEWSALEQRAQFERKMATGILFRVELAARMRALGFEVEPAASTSPSEASIKSNATRSRPAPSKSPSMSASAASLKSTARPPAKSRPSIRVRRKPSRPCRSCWRVSPSRPQPSD